MVTFNQEAYIEDAIKGVLMQQDCHFKLIIADDCSTDSTLSICKRYQQQYPDKIRLIEQSQNKGVVGNTKDCLIACKGKYIAVCEGDDYWIDKYKLKKQVAILEGNPDVSMVHTSWINLVQSTGEKNDRMLSEEDSICVRQGGRQSVAEIMSMHYYGIRFSSVCFRNDIFRKAYYDDPEMFSPNFTTCDIGIFYVMSYHGRLWRMLDKTLVYRIQKESVSITPDKAKSAKYTLGCLYIKAHYLKLYKFGHDMIQSILSPTFHFLFKFVSSTHDKRLLREIQSLAVGVGYKPTIGQRIRALITCL